MCLKRIFLIFLCLLLIIFSWKQWNISIKNFNFKSVKVSHNLIESSLKNDSQINNVHVKTDVMNVIINLSNGNIKEIKLLQYQEHLNSFKKFILFNKQKTSIYKIQEGLLSNESLKFIDKNYAINFKHYKLANDQKILRVPVEFVSKNGVQYIKNFIFKRGSYDIQIEYYIHNLNIFSVNLNLFGKIQEKFLIQKKKNIFHISSNTNHLSNISYYSDNNKYNKFSFDDIYRGRNIKIFSHDGWIGSSQKYFIISWIMNPKNQNMMHAYYLHDNQVVIEYHTLDISIFSGQKKILRSILWAGPKIQHKMSLINSSLGLSIDYGFLWFLSRPCFLFLNILHNITGNWGISIIIITFIMRFLMYPLTKFQYLTIAKIKSLQPQINTLKEKFKNDTVRLNQFVLKLYKDENIHPLGGFLPVLIQMPIFLSLYSMLVNSIELRHSPFLFWIYDLSDRDPFYILPIIMGITTFYIQKTSPPDLVKNDSRTQNIMNLVPIFLSFIFLWFPSGLVLYYLVGNIVTIIQQIIIYKEFQNIKKNKKNNTILK
ncbi:membrane protein insertase YidC [Buchnera aphidicola]|uniref:membrane protein insertase YidC n=1 Tax=Buchnera aphidicola TaxID=9 RepID=UPI0034646378